MYMSDNKSAELLAMLQTIFSSEEGFKIKIEGEYTFSVRTGNNRCLLITFINSQSSLYINYLSKCDINGTESLRRIEEFAKNIPYINTIWFTDGSIIEFCDCSFDLAMLKILTKGESWYNSLGYVSENYDIEKSYNSLIIGLSCIEFIEELRQKKIKNLFKKYSKQAINENLNRIKNSIGSTFTIRRNEYLSILENYDEFIGLRIAEIDESINYFKDEIHYFEDPHKSIQTELDKLWKKMRENKICDRGLCNWLSSFLEYICDSQILLYDQKLSKTINK